MSNEVVFLPADKHKSFLQVETEITSLQYLSNITRKM